MDDKTFGGYAVLAAYPGLAGARRAIDALQFNGVEEKEAARVFGATSS